MERRTAIESNKARLDNGERQFWMRDQQAFLYVRIFDWNSFWKLNSSLSQCYATNEKEKKSNYNQCIM